MSYYVECDGERRPETYKTLEDALRIVRGMLGKVRVFNAAGVLMAIRDTYKYRGPRRDDLIGKYVLKRRGQDGDTSF